MIPAAIAAAVLLAFPVRSDEGMWTFDNPPEDQLFERYGFVPTASWLEHARLASLRFSDGGSGSFVSPDGLALTNHHIAVGQLQKMSTPKKDFVKDGFYAKTREEEIACPDLEINQLVSYENATEAVLSAIPAGASSAEANEKRKAAIAALEKGCSETTGLRCDVLELYQGGEYWLYRYKKYTDIRLVMAPEVQAAFFGGDPDNFTYPRYNLDYAFFRVYDGGKPAHPARFFAFKGAGASDGELVFVTGHPGSTARLLTMSQLAFQRDVRGPSSIRSLRAARTALQAWSARGAEEARQAREDLFFVENSLKVKSGEGQGLASPALFAAKEAQERELLAKAAGDPALAKAAQDALDSTRAAMERLSQRYARYSVYRDRHRAHDLTATAETIVLWSGEAGKPNGQRYEEFRDSALDSLRWSLFSPAPTYPAMEEFLLARRLEMYRDELGASDPFVSALLDGRTPDEAAAQAVRGTRMGDVAFRKSLVAGGRAAVEASQDPLVRFALRIEPYYRQMRDWYEKDMEGVIAAAGDTLAKARFKAYGKGVYPDATFTLRLSVGKVAGYEQGQTRVPYKTTFGGLYARSDSFDGRAPFDLPPKLAAARRRVDMRAPLDFVTTNDITGGNSGSPVIDKDLRLVGLAFDGNVESFPNEYLYDEEKGRALSVHAGGILESLRSVYPMPALLKELESAASAMGGDHSLHH